MNTNSNRPMSDGIPQTVNDGGDDLGSVREVRSNQMQDFEDVQEAPEVEYFEDPRKAIAERQRQRRAGINPDEAAEGDDHIDEKPIAAAPAKPAGQQQQAPQQTQGAPQGTPSDLNKRFKLKVDRNEFEVSMSDALRYARIDPDEAQYFSEPQIVAIAQKQLAADMRFEEAKTAARSARPAPGSPPAPQDDADELDDVHQHVQPSNPRAKDIEVAESLQFEDAETAAQKLRNFIGEIVGETVTNREGAMKFQGSRQDILSVAAEFEQVNPDIVSNAAALTYSKTLIADLAEQELMTHAGVTREQAQWLRSQGRILDAYAAAQIDGHRLRPPREVFEEAVTRTRTDFAPVLGQQQPQQQYQERVPQIAPQPRLHDRRNAKSGLITQPTVGANTQPQVRQTAPQSVEFSRKQALLARKAAQADRLRS